MVVLSVKDVRGAEEAAARYGLDVAKLMNRAGEAVADEIRKRFELNGRRAVLLCGKGNNGGDGFVIASRLIESGCGAAVVLACGLPKTAESDAAFRRAESSGADIIDCGDSIDAALRAIENADIVVDAVFGFGFRGELPETAAALFDHAERCGKPIVAVDLPSGAECDTGTVAKHTPHCRLTVALTTLKGAHINLPARDYCGEIVQADIGIPRDCLPEYAPALITREDIRENFISKNEFTEKHDFGTVMLVCGSRDMTGAAFLSCSAAVHSGAGLVMLAAPLSVKNTVSVNLPEPIYVTLPEGEDGFLGAGSDKIITEKLTHCSAALVGCGIGKGRQQRIAAASLIMKAKIPLVIDADGINCVADDISILKKAASPVVLTPHQREFSRLSGLTVQEIAANRPKAARDFAVSHNVVLVLKGHNTVVAAPSGDVYVNATGNAGMSTGGSGDVLAGIITAFIGRGMDPVEAAKAGVYVHGAAGDIAAKRYSKLWLSASDIIDALSAAYSELE